jgi:hypothetical protein
VTSNPGPVGVGRGFLFANGAHSGGLGLGNPGRAGAGPSTMGAGQAAPAAESTPDLSKFPETDFLTLGEAGDCKSLTNDLKPRSLGLFFFGQATC